MRFEVQLAVGIARTVVLENVCRVKWGKGVNIKLNKPITDAFLEGVDDPNATGQFQNASSPWRQRNYLILYAPSNIKRL